MSNNNSKRKSPPPDFSPSQSKRQRLDSPGVVGSPDDSLTSLSSPEELLASQVGGFGSTDDVVDIAGLFRLNAGTGDGTTEGDSPFPDDEDEDEPEEGEEKQEPPEVEEDDEDEEEEEDYSTTMHHTVSAKSMPKHQPRPPQTDSAVASPAPISSKGPLRPTVGGKGKKGEDALEQAVAAREQVERRRVELKGKGTSKKTGAKTGPGGVRMNGSGSSGGLEDVLKTVKPEEEDVVVLDEEDAVVPVKRERPAIAEERDNIIRFTVVTNDSSPESLIILTGLKNIFQKQLPKMPREYIARLVYDRNHYSMAIVKRGLEVVGGITYRPFEARQFAEIVFCAITGTEQVKGYGSHLMNHLKDYVKATTRCMHFLTYADNYAIGYFKKQGFTKEVGLDRSVWAGYIKDYEGGTIMHCSMLEKIKYLEVSSIMARQKEVILSEIRQNSQSHVVHQGLSPALFQNLPLEGAIDASLVPGLKESGWTPEMDELTRRPKRGPQFAIMQRLLTSLTDHPSAWAFTAPVNGEDVTDYYKVITRPMDLGTMERKLESDLYTNLTEFIDDAKLIFSNCRAYNDSQSNYVKNANKLENFLNEQVKLFDT